MENYAEVIGEGSYGCIHKPSLKCKNKRTTYKKRVSKILPKRYAEKELKEYDVLSDIDKKHKYYLGNPILCEPAETEYNEKSFEKCEKSVGEDNKNLSDNDLLIMKDGGINIQLFADKMKKIPHSEESNEKIELFWIEFHRVLMGIQLFLKKGYLHYDMKPQNIVYDESAKRINIIDFGLMRKMSDVIEASKSSENHLGVYHWSYPFESNFINKHEFEKFKNLNTEEKEKLYKKITKEFKSNNDSSFRNFLSEMLINNSKPVIMDAFYKYLEGYLKFLQTELKDYDSFLKASLDTIDVYGTGIAIAYVNNHTQHLVDENFAKELRELSFKMTTPVLSERLTISRVIDAFENILNKYITEKRGVQFKKHKVVKITKTQKLKPHIELKQLTQVSTDSIPVDLK
jgi:serine/threonine protein kinase